MSVILFDTDWNFPIALPKRCQVRARSTHVSSCRSSVPMFAARMQARS